MSLTPETRKENFLARIAGGQGKVLTPESREEQFLQDIIDKDEEILDAVPQVVSDWLDENITQPTTPVVDASLSVSGAAADAKSTGSAISHIDTGLSNGMAQISFSPAFTLGQYIRQASGISNPSNKYARTTSFWATSGRSRIRLTSDTYEMSVSFYGSSGNITTGAGYIGYSDYTEKDVFLPRGESVVKFMITFRRSDQNELTNDDVTAFVAALEASNYTDTSLSLKDIPADAAVTGKKLLDAQPFFEANDDVTVVDTADAVFALYDALVAEYPDYITKNTLTSGDVTTYEYVLSTGTYNYGSGHFSENAPIEKPVVLLSSGVHGIERNAVMSLYTVVRALCANDYRVNSIRNAATIKVLPVVCPHGYTAGTRTNANGVNINRNFDTTGWEVAGEGTSNYTGAAAADQDETKIAQNWITANNDALLMIDFHGSMYSSELSCLLGNNNPISVKAKRTYLVAMNKIIPHWANDRKLSRTSYIYAYSGGESNGAGIFATYAVESGIDLSFTVELSMNVANSGTNSNKTIGVGAEAIATILNGFQHYYDDAVIES